MNLENAHYTFEQLADYVDGRLPESGAAALESHLAGCASCREEVSWLRETTAVMAGQWPAPPKAVRAAVHHAFRYFVPANGLPEKSELPRQAVPWFQRLFQPGRRLATAAALAILLFFISGQFYRSWAQAVIQNPVALIELSGTAEVMRSGSQEWERLAAGDVLRAGDKIRTGEDGTAGLMFFEDNITALDPNTQIEIIAFSARRDGQERVITLEQLSGRLYSKGWPPGTHITHLSIRTPSAVVSIQALGYDAVIDTDNDSEISVIKGCAEIVSYDAAAQTSNRQQTGSTCSTPLPVEMPPLTPYSNL